METERAKHKLEAAGLGKFPYRHVSVNWGGSECALCGQAIREIHTIESSDGIVSQVGSSCIKKTMACFAIASEAKQAARKLKNEKCIAEARELLDGELPESLKLVRHPFKRELTGFDYCARAQRNRDKIIADGKCVYMGISDANRIRKIFRDAAKRATP